MVTRPTETKRGLEPRMLQVSLEGLDLTNEQFARLESAMRGSVLTELARLDLGRGVTFESIGKGTFKDGHIINGIIIKDLATVLKGVQIGR